jgi:hypothetical protein
MRHMRKITVGVPWPMSFSVHVSAWTPPTWDFLRAASMWDLLCGQRLPDPCVIVAATVCHRHVSNHCHIISCYMQLVAILVIC